MQTILEKSKARVSNPSFVSIETLRKTVFEKKGQGNFLSLGLLSINVELNFDATFMQTNKVSVACFDDPSKRNNSSNNHPQSKELNNLKITLNYEALNNCGSFPEKYRQASSNQDDPPQVALKNMCDGVNSQKLKSTFVAEELLTAIFVAVSAYLSTDFLKELVKEVKEVKENETKPEKLHPSQIFTFEAKDVENLNMVFSGSFQKVFSKKENHSSTQKNATLERNFIHSLKSFVLNHRRRIAKVALLTSALTLFRFSYDGLDKGLKAQDKLEINRDKGMALLRKIDGNNNSEMPDNLTKTLNESDLQSMSEITKELLDGYEEFDDLKWGYPQLGIVNFCFRLPEYIKDSIEETTNIWLKDINQAIEYCKKNA